MQPSDGTLPDDVAPVVVARGLTLRTGLGPVFTDVDLSVERGAVAGIVGRAGSGRSALLLTLAGRMRGWTGELHVAGHDVRTQARDVRQVVSVARIADLVDLEGELVVSSSIAERALIDGIQPREAEDRMAWFEDLVGCRIPRDELVGRLSALDETRLALALALVRPAEIVVLDDADRGLDVEEQVQLGEAIAHIAGSGVTLIICVTDAHSLPPGATVHRLAPPRRIAAPDPVPDPDPHAKADPDADPATQPTAESES